MKTRRDGEADETSRPRHAAPRPRRVSRCRRCLRAGVRKPGERIDRRCRYCGGTVECETVPSTKRAHRIVRNWQMNRANALKNGELTEEKLPKSRVRVTSVTRTRARPSQAGTGHQDRSKRTSAPRPPAGDAEPCPGSGPRARPAPKGKRP